MNYDENTHFEGAVPRFCTCACQQILMISVPNHAFSMISRISSEEIHFQDREQYSAPASTLTMLMGCLRQVLRPTMWGIQSLCLLVYNPIVHFGYNCHEP